MAALHDLLHHAAHEIDGNRKSDAFGAAIGAVQHGGVDADQVAVRIDERAAGIAEIDGGIGLYEILEGCKPELLAPGGTHDALGDRLAQAVGIADREHDIADTQGVRAAQGHDGQIADAQMQNGDVRVRILPDDGRVGDPAVGKLHSDGIRARDDVLIRHDGARIVDDHARAQAAFHALPVAWPKIAEQLIERGRLGALRDHARGVYVHDGRGRPCHGIGKALHDHRRAGIDRGRTLDGRARRNGGFSQQCRPPPHHEKRRRQADHRGSDQETHEDASVLQLISLLGP